MLDASLFLNVHLAAANIMDAAGSGANIATELSKSFWDAIFKMGLFGRITQASLTIAGIGVIYKGYYYLQDVGKNTLDIDKVVGTLIALLLTILMLTNNGLAMNTVLGMRNFGNSINEKIMNGIDKDLRTVEATRDINKLKSSQPSFQIFKSSLKKCAPKAKAVCYKAAVVQLQADIAKISPADPEVSRVVNDIVREYDVAEAELSSATPRDAVEEASILDKLGSFYNGAVEAVVDAPANFIEGIIMLILTAITMCFYLALELTLILLGLTFPIHIALSLFDPAPLKTWLGNYWLLVNAKLCFCIIVGIISYLQLWVQTNSNNILLSMLLIVIGLLMAIYAPVVTFFYVQGSALALAGAMNAIPGNVVGGAAKGVIGAAGKGVGSTAGAFMGGAMKGAGVSKMGQNFGKKVAQKLGRK